MDALMPFTRRQAKAPYLADWLSTPVQVMPVRCKGDLAVSRKGAIVHRIEAAACVLSRTRIRYAVQYLCGNSSIDAVLLANADAHGGAVCPRCQIGVAGIFVYRCYADDGRLLYIGITGSYAARMSTHASTSPWWPEVANITLEPCLSLTAARAAERLAVQAEKPEHNRQWVKA